MDTEKLLAALEDGENRTAEALRVTNPASETYTKLLDNLQRTLWIEGALRGTNCVRVSPAPEDKADEPETKPAKKTKKAEQLADVAAHPEKIVKEEAPAPAEEAPAAEPEPTPEPEPAHAAEIKPCPKPEPKLTKAEVRTQLSAYANSGADVAVIMQGMGYTRLSDVPESRYAELLELAKKAVQ